MAGLDIERSARRFRLLPDDPVELRHHHGVRMGPHRRTDDVVRLLRVGNPIAHRLVGGVLEGLRTGLRRPHLGAEQAQAIGLVSAVTSPDALIDETKALARKITKNGPVAVRLALESMYRAVDTATEDALGFESSAFGLLASTYDMKEGMQAFLEKRKADFKGT